MRYHDGQGFLRCRRRGSSVPLLKILRGHSSEDGAGDSGEWLKVQYPCIANSMPFRLTNPTQSIQFEIHIAAAKTEAIAKTVCSFLKYDNF
jgi:hypothetical protein